MRVGRDKNPGALLGRALLAHARAFGCEAAVVESRGRPWASATFTGERMVIAVSGGAGLHGWIESLAEAELPVRGYYSAELVVTERTGSGAMLEALLIEVA